MPSPPDFEAEAREAEQRSVVHGPGAFTALARRMYQAGRRAGLEEAAGVALNIAIIHETGAAETDDPNLRSHHRAVMYGALDITTRIRALAEGEG